MKTVGESINEYCDAIGNGEAGFLLYENAKKILKLECSEESKIRCFDEQITFITMANNEVKNDEK